MSKHPRRFRDANQLGKMIADLATGQASEPKSNKNPAAVELGRLGGLKGGKARAEAMTAAERSAVAKKAAEARWGKS